MKRALAKILVFTSGALVANAAEAQLQNAYGGDIRGNGGHVIECDSREMPLLVDHWEATGIRGLELDMGEADADFQRNALIVIERLAGLDPYRADKFRRELRNFSDPELTRIIEIDLGATEDGTPIGLPGPDCFLRQAAVHFTNPRPGEPRYIIDRSIWDRLDGIGRAGLVLHEMIYRELAIQKRHSSSSFARWFNVLISTRELRSWTQTSYATYMKERSTYLPFFESENGQIWTILKTDNCSTATMESGDGQVEEFDAPWEFRIENQWREFGAFLKRRGYFPGRGSRLYVSNFCKRSDQIGGSLICRYVFPDRIDSVYRPPLSSNGAEYRFCSWGPH